jgi:hypothetical protein
MLQATIRSAATRMLGLTLFASLAVLSTWQPLAGQDKPLQRPLRVGPPPIAGDKSVNYDYDIVYVRAPRTAKGRNGKEQLAMVWPDASAVQPAGRDRSHAPASRWPRILVGMHDYYPGLDMDSFAVETDFPIDGLAAGENLARRFKPKSHGVWEFAFPAPLADLSKGRLIVSVKDIQGNTSRIERTFSVGQK